jgi:DeoR/GlpR family transcriptional regulator of sugar metabolism
MLASQRKQHILDVLRREGQVVAKALSDQLLLSEDTIRRDLRELSQAGLLQRVHGGALPASPAVADFSRRTQISTEGKAAIGRVAAAMVLPGQVVIVDGGTTALQLAHHLARDLRATIITHSPTIAVALVDHPTVEVVLIGGKLFKHSVVTVGAAAVEAIGKFHADTFFMGVTGIHPEVGLTTGDLEEAHIKRALSNAAADTIVLASAEKLNAASPYVIGPVSEISRVVTERSVPAEATAPFETLGIAVTRA